MSSVLNKPSKSSHTIAPASTYVPYHKARVTNENFKEKQVILCVVSNIYIYIMLALLDSLNPANKIRLVS